MCQAGTLRAQSPGTIDKEHMPYYQLKFCSTLHVASSILHAAVLMKLVSRLCCMIHLLLVISSLSLCWPLTGLPCLPCHPIACLCRGKKIAIDIVRGLCAIHEKNIIHFDVKKSDMHLCLGFFTMQFRNQMLPTLSSLHPYIILQMSMMAASHVHVHIEMSVWVGEGIHVCMTVQSGRLVHHFTAS